MIADTTFLVDLLAKQRSRRSGAGHYPGPSIRPCRCAAKNLLLGSETAPGWRRRGRLLPGGKAQAALGNSAQPIYELRRCLAARSSSAKILFFGSSLPRDSSFISTTQTRFPAHSPGQIPDCSADAAFRGRPTPAPQKETDVQNNSSQGPLRQAKLQQSPASGITTPVPVDRPAPGSTTALLSSRSPRGHALKLIGDRYRCTIEK